MSQLSQILKFEFIWIQLYLDSTMPFIDALYGHLYVPQVQIEVI